MSGGSGGNGVALSTAYSWGSHQHKKSHNCCVANTVAFAAHKHVAQQSRETFAFTRLCHHLPSKH